MVPLLHVADKLCLCYNKLLIVFRKVSPRIANIFTSNFVKTKIYSVTKYFIFILLRSLPKLLHERTRTRNVSCKKTTKGKLLHWLIWIYSCKSYSPVNIFINFTQFCQVSDPVTGLGATFRLVQSI